jgi:ketosteroid isomerase-like protein
MTRDEMEKHARNWIAAWNGGDVDRVLADFADDARFVSPRAAQITGNPEVRGKAALGRYWRQATANLGTPRFRLDRVICDTAGNEMLVIYDRLRDGSAVRACEIMRFDADGRQIEGEAFYGAEILASR